jgi:hypothetical protein
MLELSMPSNSTMAQLARERLGVESTERTIRPGEDAGCAERVARHTMARVVQGLGAAAVALYVIILITGQVGSAISGVSNGSAYFQGALDTVDTVTESSFILAAVGLIVLVGGALIAAVRGFGNGGGGRGGMGR